MASKKATKQAPKRAAKQAPKRTTKSSASTSRASEPVDVIFEEKRANMEKRKIVTGRIVTFPKGVERDICEAVEGHLQDLGYDVFLDFKNLGLTQKEHIEHFYAMFSVDEANHLINFRMYGTAYSIPFAQFSEIMRIPIHGPPFFCRSSTSYAEICDHLKITPQELLRPLLESIDPLPASLGFRHGALKKQIKFINKLVIANILPRRGEKDKINGNQLYILYCLTTGTQFNLFHIMKEHMKTLEASPRGPPYGIHLNLLFRHLDLHRVPTVAGPKPLDASFFNRSKAALNFNMAKKRRRAENDEADSSGVATQESLDMLKKGQEGLQSGQTELLLTLTGQQVQIEAMQGQIDSLSGQIAVLTDLLRQVLPSHPPPQ